MKIEPRMPEPGEEAPEFTGRTQDGDEISLSDYRGRRLALYFYPRDDTPGCTKQACSLRDSYHTLLDEGIAVVGVSADDEDAHARFAEKYELPFPLIADPQHTILDRYGVWREKNLYGRKFMGIQRTTFLIDEEGIIRDVIKKPNTGEHADEVRSRFAAV